MSENLIIGFVTMAVCLAIQCIVVGALLDVLVFLEKIGIQKSMLEIVTTSIKQIRTGWFD